MSPAGNARSIAGRILCCSVAVALPWAGLAAGPGAPPASAAAPPAGLVFGARCGPVQPAERQQPRQFPYQAFGALKATQRGVALARVSPFGVFFEGRPFSESVNVVVGAAPSAYPGPSLAYRDGFAVSAGETGSSATPAAYVFLHGSASADVPHVVVDRARWEERAAGGAWAALAGTRPFGPEAASAFGATGPAHLLEVEVNGGRGRGAGSLDPHFVVTGARVLDGTPEFPWRLVDVLGALRAHYDGCLGRSEPSLEAALGRGETGAAPRRARPGPERRTRADGVWATWDEERQTLVVLFETWVGSRRCWTWTERVEGPSCPKGAPCLPAQTTQESRCEGRSAWASYEFEVSARSGVRHVGFMPPR